MICGVIIENGFQDWQIIQLKNGHGKDPIADESELGVHLLKNSGHSPYLSFAKPEKKETGYPTAKET